MPESKSTKKSASAAKTKPKAAAKKAAAPRKAAAKKSTASKAATTKVAAKKTSKAAPKKTVAKKAAPKKAAAKKSKAAAKPAGDEVSVTPAETLKSMTKEDMERDAEMQALVEETEEAIEAASADATGNVRNRTAKQKAVINERVRVLIRLSKEQGYLTYKDINDNLPESVNSTEDIENVITILENLDIDVIGAEEVERYKQRLEEHWSTKFASISW